MKRKRISLFVSIVLTIGVLGTMPQVTYAASCSGTDIVLSEISYDDDGTDEHEFVEILIPNAVSAGDFDSCVIRLLNQTQTVQHTLDLSTLDDSGIAAGTRLLWGSTNVAGRDATIGSCASNCIQNGPEDGIALVDTSGGDTVRWYWTYEDSDPTESYLGFSATNMGTENPSFCNDGTNSTETSISWDGSGWVENSCATPGESNQGPNVITLSSLSAHSASARPFAWPFAALAALTLTGLLWARRRRLA